MSQGSSRLALPYLASGQAQKHVTVNEALLRLDALVQLAVVSATTAVQPGSPVDGSVYILPPGKTGAAWDAMANHALAYYRDGAWEEIAPREGWIAAVNDSERVLRHTGVSWLPIAPLTSPADGVATLVNAAESGFDRLQFGGSTAAFPAWKRSGAELHARLADDSGFAGVRALQATLGGGPALTLSTPCLDMSQTWNNGAVAFAAARISVTDTASALNSYYLSILRNGYEVFNVVKTSGNNTQIQLRQADGTIRTAIGSIGGEAYFQLLTSASLGVFVYGEGANVLALKNGANAQGFRVYNTHTDASNYERGALYWTGNQLRVAAQRAGTGSAREIGFETNGSVRWRIGTGGDLLAGADNSYDVGGPGGGRPRNAYLGGFLSIGDGVAAPVANVGEAKIYVDAADGDLKIVFGDGTVRTIVTD